MYQGATQMEGSRRSRIVVVFRRPLVGERSPGAEDARGAGH